MRLMDSLVIASATLIATIATGVAPAAADYRVGDAYQERLEWGCEGSPCKRFFPNAPTDAFIQLKTATCEIRTSTLTTGIRARAVAGDLKVHGAPVFNGEYDNGNEYTVQFTAPLTGRRLAAEVMIFPNSGFYMSCTAFGIIVDKQ